MLNSLEKRDSRKIELLLIFPLSFSCVGSPFFHTPDEIPQKILFFALHEIE